MRPENTQGPHQNTRSKTNSANSEQNIDITDMPVSFEIFDGTPSKAASWLKSCEAKGRYNKLDDAAMLLALPAHLTGPAILWHDSLPEGPKSSLESWKTAFETRFGVIKTPTPQSLRDLLAFRQGPSQSLGEFAAEIQQIGVQQKIPEEQQFAAVMNGVDRDTLPFIEMMNLSTVGAIIGSSIAHRRPHALAPVAAATPTDISTMLQDIKKTIQATIAPVRAASPARRDSSRERKVHFRPLSPWTRRDQREDSQRKPCGKCGLYICRGSENCGAWGKVCYKCQKYNHFARVCRS